MTRFARSKGSKASNEKLPERATSWSEMKEELLNKNKELAEQKDREAFLKKRQANYQAFLQEREEEEDKNISWADFPDTTFAGNSKKLPQKRKFNDDENSSSPIKLDKNPDLIHHNGDYGSEDSDGEFSALKLQIDKVLAKQCENGSDSDDDSPPEEVSIKEKPQEIVVKKVKKPKQKLKIVLDKELQLSKNAENGPKKNIQQKSLEENNVKEKILTEKDKKLILKKHERHKKQTEKKKLKREEQREKKKSDNPDLPAEKLDNIEMSRTQKKLERRKKQKEKKKLKQESGLKSLTEKKVKPEENLSESDMKKIQKKKERRARQAEKRQKLREEKALAAEENKEGVEGNQDQAQKISGVKGNIKELNDNNGSISNGIKKFNQQEQNGDFRERKPFQKLLSNQKKVKPRDKDHPSRKQKPEKMFINGKTIEIDYIEGFPVKKEDADRLRKLRKEMISKGLPRSEINAALKLERRRAEKAFAREKKNVCFNCRKSGHNLSECPDLDKDQVAQSAGTGICFKCGSTEHTHFECKVVRGLDYKFATCFICKEQGHIAKQCPDNQRGLYPKGGSCKVCGDVTHLKKDCPKYQVQQSHLQNGLSIGTLDNGNPDDLSAKGANNSFAGAKKSLNKIVKF